MKKLTIGTLANLCNHAWEMQREVAFHMQDVTAFRQHITNMPALELRNFMENLGLFFSTTRDIGESEIELKANGAHSLYAPLCQTKTARELGVDENVVVQPPPRESQEAAGT